ncbi:hypothetical protein NE237_002884 [Protea cynaroides]|uniref:Uncharacterized protein n=1 Tax=Protea cynaroides TaxID=273540 RepID=A0A9Q0KG24_9MAGN|nr:hypothetical protein NE237_002884 [Protea cynaroides]
MGQATELASSRGEGLRVKSFFYRIMTSIRAPTRSSSNSRAGCSSSCSVNLLRSNLSKLHEPLLPLQSLRYMSPFPGRLLVFASSTKKPGKKEVEEQRGTLQGYLGTTRLTATGTAKLQCQNKPSSFLNITSRFPSRTNP